MLYQLRNLTPEERDLVVKAPVWVTLLVACADHNIDEKEVNRGKEIMKIKSFAEKNDVKDVYEALEKNMDEEIDNALKQLSAKGSERITFIENELTKLNKLFPKMNVVFAKQYLSSLKQLALFVAQSSGGFFGVKSISAEESKYINLPMLQLP